MSDLKSIVVATVNGEEVRLHEILYSMKINNKLDFLKDAVNEVLIAQAVEKAGITVSDAELQDAVDRFRQQAGLHKTPDTHDWLKRKFMTAEDLQTRLERTVATRKLKKTIADDQAVERYFAENQLRFGTAQISHIVVAQEGMAEEILLQVQEEEADFATLARNYSIDRASKNAGGYVGWVNRRTLGPQVESVVFAANEGDVVGPTKTDMGYHIIRVERIQPGTLDNQTKAEITNILFTKWLEAQNRTANIDLRLMTMI